MPCRGLVEAGVARSQRAMRTQPTCVHDTLGGDRQAVIKLIEQLAAAMITGEDRQSCSAACDELLNFTVDYFAMETTLMNCQGAPRTFATVCMPEHISSGPPTGMALLRRSMAAETSRLLSVRHSPARRNRTMQPPIDGQGVSAPLHSKLSVVNLLVTDRPQVAAGDQTHF
jgi:hypothetical protein